MSRSREGVAKEAIEVREIALSRRHAVSLVLLIERMLPLEFQRALSLGRYHTCSGPQLVAVAHWGQPCYEILLPWRKQIFDRYHLQDVVGALHVHMYHLQPEECIPLSCQIKCLILSISQPFFPIAYSVYASSRYLGSPESVTPGTPRLMGCLKIHSTTCTRVRYFTNGR